MKITTKYIEDRLKEYKENSSTIETTLARIDVYKKAINNVGDRQSFTHIFTGSQTEIGMPRGTGGRPSSSVELEIENDEENEEEVIEMLKEWIKDDLSRIYPLQVEKEQIDGALNALTKQQRFIIDEKYFEGMFWREIEFNFNEDFGQKNYITVEGLRKLNRQALGIMVKVLSPYYERFKIRGK